MKVPLDLGSRVLELEDGGVGIEEYRALKAHLVEHARRCHASAVRGEAPPPLRGRVAHHADPHAEHEPFLLAIHGLMDEVRWVAERLRDLDRTHGTMLAAGFLEAALIELLLPQVRDAVREGWLVEP
ncbi:MAG: hypothetical protein HYV08_01025 [Deltaproteobacteria bacterium]|nr:hypothetical protein [Deltaproteobacteria bacterium]